MYFHYRSGNSRKLRKEELQNTKYYIDACRNNLEIERTIERCIMR